MTNLLPYAIAWGVLVLVVIGLAVMRKSVAKKEDDFVHLSGDMSVVANQTEVASKLEAIDKWGKMLTIVAVITGAILAVVYALQLWEASSTAGLR
jgi:uncharacterized membrane protein